MGIRLESPLQILEGDKKAGKKIRKASQLFPAKSCCFRLSRMDVNISGEKNHNTHEVHEHALPAPCANISLPEFSRAKT